jgi:hypothetical protein
MRRFLAFSVSVRIPFWGCCQEELFHGGEKAEKKGAKRARRTVKSRFRGM